MAEEADQLALVRSLRRQAAELASENQALKGGGGGGTSNGVEAVDAKIAAAEARTDTKFAELRADLKDFATKGTVWTAAGTLAALLLAAMAFGGNRFDSGMSASGIARSIQAEQQKVDARQDGQLQSIDRKLDVLISRSAAKPQDAATKR